MHLFFSLVEYDIWLGSSHVFPFQFSCIFISQEKPSPGNVRWLSCPGFWDVELKRETLKLDCDNPCEMDRGGGDSSGFTPWRQSQGTGYWAATGFSTWWDRKLSSCIFCTPFVTLPQCYHRPQRKYLRKWILFKKRVLAFLLLWGHSAALYWYFFESKGEACPMETLSIP